MAVARTRTRFSRATRVRLRFDRCTFTTARRPAAMWKARLPRRTRRRALTVTGAAVSSTTVPVQPASSEAAHDTVTGTSPRALMVTVAGVSTRIAGGVVSGG